MGPVVVVTGANGLVGSRVCAELAGRGVAVRAVVRRPGTAPDLGGVEEVVGDFADPHVAEAVARGASAVVTTVHPMGSDAETQHRVGVVGTSIIATAARDAGADRFIHVSTAAVYDRSPAAGDVAESSALVGDDAGDYPVTKRDTDAALAQIEGITRVLLRPPAILGAGETSVWNTLRPAGIRDGDRHAVPEKTFAWIHVDDLARLAADLSVGSVPDAAHHDDGPVPGGCTPVNVAAGPATERDYVAAVAQAVGVEPIWDEGPAWTGHILTDRARAWGWSPRIGWDEALTEVVAGLTG